MAKSLNVLGNYTQAFCIETKTMALMIEWPSVVIATLIQICKLNFLFSDQPPWSPC